MHLGEKAQAAAHGRSTFLHSVSGLILRPVKTSRWHCCIRTTSGHSHLLLKITKDLKTASLSLLLSLFATRGMQNFLAECCILTNFWSFSSTSENHNKTVRFQKKMRPVSLEIPEADATGYQNLMRQNPKLTRSRATRSTLRPKCPQSAERPLARAARKTGEEIGAGKRVRGLPVSGHNAGASPIACKKITS